VSVTIERDEGVATVTVDSPPVNAMGREVLEELERTGAELRGDSDVRAVVLTGAGEKAFMAGGDISEYDELIAGNGGGIESYVEWANGIFTAWETLPQPVVAAVQANAVGGGLEIALACDLIVLDGYAEVGMPEVRLGLIPGGGGTQRLVSRVGPVRAKRMMMFGSLLPAWEALAVGLADVVASPGTAVAEATGLAAKLATLPAVAVQAIKKAVDDPQRPGLDGGLEIERREFLGAFGSDDFREGYKAFLEKRKPVFRHS
jgi:enoyl-CoA hydratase/carnithine racemase